MSEAVAQLIENIRLSGGVVSLKDGKLTLSGPESVKKRFLADLRAQKAEVVAFLASRKKTPPIALSSRKALSVASAEEHLKTCRGCYEIAPGVMIHPPRSAYKNEE